MASLRNHRSAASAPVSSLAVVSLLFAATPWLFPSAWGVAFGLAAHLGWFLACEMLAPAARSKIRPAPTAEASRSVPAAAQPPRPTGFADLPVLATFNETGDIKTIRFRRPDGFDFEAGQFVAVRTRIDGKEVSRCYSVSSAPDVRGYFEISIKRQGLVSSALHATARPGALIAVRSPSGAFKYPSSDDRPIVLLAGGVGITPLISMLRHAVHAEPSRPVTLLYSARSDADFAFREELAALARRHPQVAVHLACSKSQSADVYPGRLDADLIRATVADVAHAIYLICGPSRMIDDMKTLLASLGVPAPQIRSEVFEAAVAAAAAREDAPATARSRPVTSAAHQLTCRRSGRTVPISAGQTLLEAAETAGLPIESMCRAGVCGTCRVRVTDGEVDCTSDTLSPGEQAEGFVLACVSTVRSGCTLDL
jgi:ferredoxin-NADP reductase